MGSVILCPRCPRCGAAPMASIIPMQQGICPTDGCPVFTWDMYATAAEFERTASTVDLGLDPPQHQ